MILAAGRGNRMQPLTDTIPKPLLKIGEHALIEYHLFNLKKAGITDIVINVAYLPKKIIAALGDGERYGVNITYSFENREDGLETGGGVFQALPLLGDDPFIVISADIFSDFDFTSLPKKINGLAHLVMVDNPDHHLQGDYSLLDNDLLSLDGSTKLNYAGIAVLDPRLFIDCRAGKFSLGSLFKTAIKNNKVSGQYYSGAWYNVGTVSKLNELNAT